MTQMELYIKTLTKQLINMPNGYVKDTVEACLNLAVGIKENYENPNNGSNQPTNQD